MCSKFFTQSALLTYGRNEQWENTKWKFALGNKSKRRGEAEPFFMCDRKELGCEWCCEGGKKEDGVDMISAKNITYKQ